MTLDRDHLFIDGQWGAGQAHEVVEAATEKVLGVAAVATTADVDLAVAAARRALPAWTALGPDGRADVLRALAKALKARAKETGALVSRENGMPVTLSVPAEGLCPSMIVRWYAEHVAGTSPEETRKGSFGGDVVVRTKPVGVVAAVTPWNYPQALSAMKIAPALAAGCTVVLKAAPETALDAYVWADAALETGLPPGVLNVVPGGREVGAHLVSHTGVDKVAFTGSTVAGRAIARTCGELLRPVTLELGGKSAAVLLEDADLGAFTASLLDVCLPNNGQTCHASTRILAPRSRFAAVVAAVSATVDALRIGDPSDPATQIGPVATAAQRSRVLGLLAGAAQQGRVTTTRTAVPDQGWFVAPTVVSDVAPTAELFQEEVFGPVLTITAYDTEDDAVALANDSRYGLAGTVWTSDVERGVALTARIESGTLGVNHYLLDLAAPFGGVKASGLGRELGPEGLHAYQSQQTVYLR